MTAITGITYICRNCSATDIERDSSKLAELAPAGRNRPFMVIDDGWSITNTAGPWERGNVGFPDMPRLAAAMKQQGVQPGIWLRAFFTTVEICPPLLTGAVRPAPPRAGRPCHTNCATGWRSSSKYCGRPR